MFGRWRGCSQRQVEVRQAPADGCATGVGVGRDGRPSLATSPAAAQLLSVPICACSVHSDPTSLSSQLPLCGSAPATGTWTRHSWTPATSLENVTQMNSDGERTSAFSAFPSPARVHSGKLRLGTLGAHTARRGSRGNHLGSPGPALPTCKPGVQPLR